MGIGTQKGKALLASQHAGLSFIPIKLSTGATGTLDPCGRVVSHSCLTAPCPFCKVLFNAPPLSSLPQTPAERLLPTSLPKPLTASQPLLPERTAQLLDMLFTVQSILFVLLNLILSGAATIIVPLHR